MNNDNSVLSRGDVRRNQQRRRLREIVAPDRAIVAIDLAEQVQEVVVCDHDNVVLARRTKKATRAWELGPTLAWARRRGRAAGFDDVVVACEPTGHRWRVIAELCDDLGVDVVCVQPLLVHRERERDDLTRDRSDARDAVLIASLVAQLRCYVPERATATWARLRHLGARRDHHLVAEGSCRQQIGDLAGCCWPTALDAAAKPLDSVTWQAAIAVVCDRIDGGDLAGVRTGWRRGRYATAVRRTVRQRGGQRVCWRIAHGVWDGLADPGGVPSQRHGALERIGLVLADLDHTRTQLADVETRMVAVLDELDLTDLVISIDGLSAVGAAAILAQTGDLTRFGSARSVVKHAGICPRNNHSGTYAGDTTISHRGRPSLRTAAWRAVWGALPNNPVLAARYHHLTTRDTNRLTGQQAHTAVAGSLLRQLYAVVTTRTRWDPAIAAGHRRVEGVMPQAA